MLYIYPYKKGSQTVASLKGAIDQTRVLKLDGSKFTGGKHKNVLNWGNSDSNLEVEASTVLNKPKSIRFASNKRNFFNELDKNGVKYIPPFTTERSEAFSWIEEKRYVCVREKLTGHSGEGLVILHNSKEWEEYDHSRAKLYVQYIPKKEEFRVHVFNNQVIDIQKKSTMSGIRAQSYEIQNHHNGFIFTRNNIKSIPDGLEQACIDVISMIGLDFGAVDVIHNKRRGQFYVLEVNTAPGLTNTTLKNYVDAITDYFSLKVNEDFFNQEEVEEGLAPEEAYQTTSVHTDTLQWATISYET